MYVVRAIGLRAPLAQLYGRLSMSDKSGMELIADSHVP